MKSRDNQYFRIQHDEHESPSNHVDRSYKKYDTSEQWGFGGVAEKRIFVPTIQRVLLYSFILILMFGIIIFRLTQLQIVNGQEYRDKSEGNRIRTQLLDAPRGLIYDRNGKELVTNVPTFYLAFVSADLPRDNEELLSQLDTISNITGESIDVLENIIDESSRISFRPKLIVDDISYEDIVLLKTKLKNWSGFEIGIRGSRFYPMGKYTSHVLGYLRKLTADDIATGKFDNYQFTDYIGKSGIEEQYESILKGQTGKKQVEINVRGQVQKVINEQLPVSGSNITLSIDSAIQEKLFDILQAKLDELELSKATAIAIQPQTGEILAAVSLPAYDNNLFSGKIDSAIYADLISNEDLPLFFRALQGEYPSGSTFKPIVALAALKDGIITPQTVFLSNGGIRVNRWFFPDWKAGGHGITNVTKALAESVNTFFYIIGGGYNNIRGLGVDRIVDFAKKFYYTKQLGIDYPSEADGFLPSRQWKEETKKERWYIGDTYNISIGQGDVLVTPLQVTTMIAYFANGGKIYRPHFLKKIEYADGTYQDIEPEVLRDDTIDQQYIKTVREGLKAAVDEGSARSLSQFKPFQIAGKTGTAQVSGNQDPHAWFVSFAPFDNPSIALTILIENGESSNNAVAVAREFYRWYIDEYFNN